MKVLSLALLLMAGMAFVMLGCSDTATPLVSPNDAVASSVTSQASLAKEAAIHSVAGNGNIWIEGKMGVLTINAHQYEGGSVKGRLNLVNTAFNPHSHYAGDVVALAVYENYTFSTGVSGRTAVFCWREETNEETKGKYVVGFVVDIGEGNKATGPDWVGPTSGPYDNITLLDPQVIADPYPEFFVPLAVGNVQVR
jgi:hypothetical protein